MSRQKGRLATGFLLIMASVVMAFVVMTNVTTQMDVVDRTGEAGNLFAPDILLVALLGLALAIAGVVVAARSHSPR